MQRIYSERINALHSPLGRMRRMRSWGLRRIQRDTVTEGVELIKKNAFLSSKVTEGSLQDSLRFIGESAFANCFYLKKISLTKSIESIGPKDASNLRLKHKNKLIFMQFSRNMKINAFHAKAKYQSLMAGNFCCNSKN